MRKRNKPTASKQHLTRNEQLTLLLSVAALIVAVWAIKLSSDANGLAQKTYKEERRITLRTERVEDKSSSSYSIIRFIPLDSSAHVTAMGIYFPSKLRIPPITLNPNDLSFPEIRIRQQLMSYLDERIGAETNKFIATDSAIPIPALIFLHGSTIGVAVKTAAVYYFFSGRASGVEY